SLAIDTESYWFTCMRYVELNPVRAGITGRPEEYRWSSYRFHALGEHNDLIVPHHLYVALGNTTSMRQQSWRAICGEALPEEQLAECETWFDTEEPCATRSPRQRELPVVVGV